MHIKHFALWLIAVAVIGVASIQVCRGDGKEKKHDNCLIVSGLEVDSRVTLEYQDSHGDWHNVVSKMIGKTDKLPWEICHLKPGTTYRVIARKQGDDNEGNWLVFKFQADPKTGAMEVHIIIKVRAPQQPLRR